MIITCYERIPEKYKSIETETIYDSSTSLFINEEYYGAGASVKFVNKNLNSFFSNNSFDLYVVPNLELKQVKIKYEVHVHKIRYDKDINGYFSYKGTFYITNISKPIIAKIKLYSRNYL